MKKIVTAGFVTLVAALAFAVPASADYSFDDAMAVCLVHHSARHCQGMSHDQMMEFMRCMGGSHHGPC